MTELKQKAGLHATDLVAPARQLITPKQALKMHDDIEEGAYISLPNMNNLAESLIYRRNSFKSQDNTVLPWDGSDDDGDWYYKHYRETIFYIYNANELAALNGLLAAGIDFSGKTIRLMSNINMNGKRWNPLGRSTTGHGVFRGTFDGNGHGIYNVVIEEPDNDYSPPYKMAFFDHLEDAIVKSVIFENIQVNTNHPTIGYSAAVAVSATRTVFSDVSVSGVISGNICAAITVDAIDASFHNCVNRASIYARSFTNNDVISCAGFVARLQLSEKVRINSKGNPVMCFQKCSQCGDVIANISHNLRLLSVGQLYSEFIEETEQPEDIASLLIDRCTTEVPNQVRNWDRKTIDDCSYLAIVNGKDENSCKFNSDGFKRDLIDGLIGRTPAATEITIVRPTASIVVNNMVIPGSVNTLHTKQYTKSFITTKTDSITSEDGIVNMSPYYDFVTSIGI